MWNEAHRQSPAHSGSHPWTSLACSTSLNRSEAHLWRISLTGVHEVTRLSEIGCPGEGLRLHCSRRWRRGLVRSSYCVLLSSIEHYRGVHCIGPKVMGLLPGLARTHAVCPSYWVISCRSLEAGLLRVRGSCAAQSEPGVPRPCSPATPWRRATRQLFVASFVICSIPKQCFAI